METRLKCHGNPSNSCSDSARGSVMGSITNVCRILLWTRNLCTKFHVNPSHRYVSVDQSAGLTKLNSIIYEVFDAEILSTITLWAHCGLLLSSHFSTDLFPILPAVCLHIKTHLDKLQQARFMTQTRCQTTDAGTVKKQSQPEKMDQWNSKQLIHNQCDCEWWARRVNKQIRFKRTGHQFGVTQEKN